MGINFSGIASGIDGNAIIESTIEAKKISQIPLQNKIAINDNESVAIDKLKEKLLTLTDILKRFSTINGTAVSKNIVSSDETKISGAVSGSASTGTISLRVDKLARAGRVTFDSQFPALDSLVAPSLVGTGTFSITLGSGPDAVTKDVTIDSTTTISGLARSISDAFPDKVSSTLVNVGTVSSPQYKLMVSSTNTGAEKGFLDIQASSEIIAEAVFNSSQITQAEDAEVFIEGVGAVTRPTNLISDILPGISFNIKETSAQMVSLRISADSDKTEGRLNDVVTAFNEILSFVATQSKITQSTGDKGSKNIYGDLARTRVDDQLITNIRGALRSVRGGENDVVKILGDIGIETTKEGVIAFKPDVFKKALSENVGQVETMLKQLADKFTSVTGIVNSYTTFDGLFAQGKKANQTENDSVARRLADMDANLERQTEYLRKLFSRLETTVGKLNSNASALTSLLPQQQRK